MVYNRSWNMWRIVKDALGKLEFLSRFRESLGNLNDAKDECFV
jgi:hypothetical protein